MSRVKIGLVKDDKHRPVVSFEELIADIDTKYASYVLPPGDWPPCLNQGKTPTCGLFALAMALRMQAGVGTVPKVFGRGGLLDCARNLGVTRKGSIFNIHHLKTILDHFQFDSAAQIVNQMEYHSRILEKLSRREAVIVACDLSENPWKSFPGQSRGMRSHWALVFGYYVSKSDKQAYYLVCQYGKYYLWRAGDLYLSNEAMPLVNLRISVEEFLCIQSGNMGENFVPGDGYLYNFKFGILSIGLQTRRASVAREVDGFKPRNIETEGEHEGLDAPLAKRLCSTHCT